MVDKKNLCQYFFMACFCISLHLGHSQEVENLKQMNIQVVNVYQEGRYQEAIILAQKAYNYGLSSLGEKHPDTLASMGNLAELYRSQGKYEKAEPLSLKNWQLKREVLGEKHPHTLTSMNNLALLYKTQEQYIKAERLYLELMKETFEEDHESTVNLMNDLAELYHFQGKYKKAEPLFIKSLKFSKKVLGERHSSTLNSMNHLAELYHSQGEYRKAEPLFLKTLQHRKEMLGEKHPNTLNSMGNLAVLYYTQGEYKKAEPLYLKALHFSTEVLGEKHPFTLNSMNNLAELYRSQSEYRKAKPLYLKALHFSKEVLGKKNHSTINSMNNLALFYGFQGEYKKAELLLEKALQFSMETLTERHPSTLNSMNYLAKVYYFQGEYTKSEPLYIKALQLRREVLGEKHPSTLHSMNHLALLHYSQGEYTKSLSTFKEYLMKKYVFLKGELQSNSGKTRLSMLKQFNVVLDKNNLFSILEAHAKDDILPLYFSVNYKGILLQVSQEMKNLFSNADDQQLVKQLLEKRSIYSNLSLDYEKRKKNRSLVGKLEKEIDELEKKLIWKSSDFKDLVSDVKVEEVQKSLTKNELLVDFIVYKSLIKERAEYKLVAIIADRDYVKLVNIGSFNNITSQIKSYRAKIQSKQNTKELSEKIYERVFSPLEKYFHAKKKIYIVPDGVLHLLPLRSLINKSGQYLTKSKNIVILSSSRDLVFKNTKKSNNTAAIFAYPNYGSGKGKEVVEDKVIRFTPLRETLSEAQSISSAINIPTKVYTQDQATEKNISQLDSPKILHIATHGYFLDTPEEEDPKDQRRMQLPMMRSMSSDPLPSKKLTNPLVYSGLALAGANDPGDKGILTALEVLGLNLRGTDLVVLSACETGVGEIRQGEGVYSLQRAFQEAGAKSVLATLWKVDDKATQLFMEKFYKRYMSGMSVQRAIRDTQLDFINSKRYSHPYYWSSFVMIGGRSDDLDQIEPQVEKVAAEKTDYTLIISVVLILLVISIIALLILTHRKKEKRLQEEKIARRKKRREMRK